MKMRLIYLFSLIGLFLKIAMSHPSLPSPGGVKKVVAPTPSLDPLVPDSSKCAIDPYPMYTFYLEFIALSIIIILKITSMLMTYIYTTRYREAKFGTFDSTGPKITK